MSFERLVRFVPLSDGKRELIGQPVEKDIDVGKAVRNGEKVRVKVFTGSSVLAPGSETEKVEVIQRILSPLSMAEVGSIRCIGVNYRKHAEETNAAIPTEPNLFIKPATALGDPWPKPTVIPKHTVQDDTADYESELAIVIGKTCKNVSEDEALDYVLGYTAANDVSSRKCQFAQAQACYSKGFDGSCPLGPVLVSSSLIPDPSKLTIRGLRNGQAVQDSGLNDLIFDCQKIVSFLSQGTTLLPGTVILTGTPSGVGHGMNPPSYLQDGEEFAVEVTPYIGSLYSIFEKEK